MNRLLLCLVIGCAALTSRAGELKVGLMPAMNSVPLVVASENGFFAEEGVKVELILFSSQLNREAALQSNAIDGSISDLINAIQALSNGISQKVTSASEGVFSLLASPKSTLQSLRDWPKKGTRKVKCGLLSNSVVYYATDRILAKVGADPAVVELIPIMQVPVRVEMLLDDRVEAACLPEPMGALAVARGARRIGDTTSIDIMPGVLLFTAKALVEKPGEISAFYRAYDRAVAEVNANPTAYRRAVVKGCGFPETLSTTLMIPRFRPAFIPSARDVADVGHWMKEKGLLSTLPAYEDIVSGAFVPQTSSR